MPLLSQGHGTSQCLPPSANTPARGLGEGVWSHLAPQAAPCQVRMQLLTSEGLVLKKSAMIIMRKKLTELNRS